MTYLHWLHNLLRKITLWLKSDRLSCPTYNDYYNYYLFYTYIGIRNLWAIQRYSAHVFGGGRRWHSLWSCLQFISATNLANIALWPLTRVLRFAADKASLWHSHKGKSGRFVPFFEQKFTDTFPLFKDSTQCKKRAMTLYLF